MINEMDRSSIPVRTERLDQVSIAGDVLQAVEAGCAALRVAVGDEMGGSGGTVRPKGGNQITVAGNVLPAVEAGRSSLETTGRNVVRSTPISICS